MDKLSRFWVGLEEFDIVDERGITYLLSDIIESGPPDNETEEEEDYDHGDEEDDDEAKREAARAHFGDLIAKEMDKMQQESEEKRDKARKFARMFRLLCPSYYVPGKQGWGAF